MATKVPDWIPQKWEEAWLHPWDDAKNKHGNDHYLDLLDEHGHITPNFTWAEASGKERNRYGTDVPDNLRKNARRHAWSLEKLRHETGDKPVLIYSWYRNPRHNDDVGGASQSRHMQADATDHTRQYAASRPNFDQICDRIWANGGFGTYPGGARHTDDRGTRARWSSF